MADVVFDPIDVAIDIDLAVTTDIEFQSILSESVKESIRFLAIEKKVTIEEANEVNSFSSEKVNKTQKTKTSHDIKGRKLEAIILQKINGS
ncbi:hypothetical protein J1N35_004864 [Gossypium stocksii]|uniref:Uncharacterized protein n=1 Tax=Gossypium stocksii TaxID=47602 RepID=A0A9D3WCS0_9ROSI|nr:hypothetical protein J1N35_004864 [Gossypium stocksii]